MILAIKRTFECKYSILEVEYQEGGCGEEYVVENLPTLESALLNFEMVKPAPNCNYYIVVNFTELKKAGD